MTFPPPPQQRARSPRVHHDRRAIDVARESFRPSIWFVGILVIGGITAVVSLVVDAGLSVPAYLLVSSIVLLDGFDIVARLWLRQRNIRRVARQPVPTGKARPFAILVSIHNMERSLDAFLEALKPYRAHVWIVDDASTDNTVSRLRASGWRYLALQKNVKKPGAIRELLKIVPAEVGTILVMDPDVSLPANLAERIHVFQQSGAAAMCPKVTIRPDGNLAEMQHIEYALSFDLGRASLSPHTVTSGVAVYDRAVLDKIMKQHSLSVYGEDLENAVGILANGQNIIYDPELVLQTDGKRTFRGWFSQRVGWSFSLFKIYAERHTEVLKIMERSPIGFYQFGVYFGLLCILLWPLKISSIVLLAYCALNGIDELLALNLVADNSFNHPAFFAACYFKYTAVGLFAYVFVSPRESIGRGLLFLPLFFLYCIMVVLPTMVGYLNWITLRLFGFRVYPDHYDANPVLGKQASEA
jgi:cellulose synthase/poly-beta-1,6-N-acetylglucosamine synthase-like glycosyltransferase